MVELEPKLAASDLADRFDTGGTDGGQRERNVVIHSRFGQVLARVGPHQPLQANRGNSKRRIVGFAKQLGLLLGSREISQVPGLQLNLADITVVSRKIDFRKTASRKVVISKARHPRLGLGSEVIDRRILGVEM